MFQTSEIDSFGSSGINLKRNGEVDSCKWSVCFARSMFSRFSTDLEDSNVEFDCNSSTWQFLATELTHGIRVRFSLLQPSWVVAFLFARILRLERFDLYLEKVSKSDAC